MNLPPLSIRSPKRGLTALSRKMPQEKARCSFRTGCPRSRSQTASACWKAAASRKKERTKRSCAKMACMPACGARKLGRMPRKPPLRGLNGHGLAKTAQWRFSRHCAVTISRLWRRVSVDLRNAVFSPSKPPRFFRKAPILLPHIKSRRKGILPPKCLDVCQQICG